jgi:nucleoside-diphosphate-sugar epimerase
MRIIIIGGTHFMGPHVVRELAAGGHEVTVFHRGAGCHDPTHVHGDRKNLPRDLHGDVVIDMWCMTEADARVTSDHFRDERRVVISSADVYRQYDGLWGRYDGLPDPVPLRETAPVREKLYPYREGRFNDYEKILVERILAGKRTTILRLPAVYGPNDEQHRFAGWLAQMDSGREVIRIDARQAGWRWTRGFSENVADAIVLAALDERAPGKTYNVGEPDAPIDEEWLRMVAEAAGWRGRIERGDDVEGTLPLRFQYDLFTDTSAIRRELGYRERVGREDALSKTVAWERQFRALE